MALVYGFFNSENGDRKYNAEEIGRYLQGIISDGVFADSSDSLQVMANGDMTTAVQPGRAMLDFHWLENTEPFILQHDIGTALARYDAVVMKLDMENRCITIEVKKGTPAAAPAIPAVERTDTIKEYMLGAVFIEKLATSFTQSAITDTRPNNSVCGWVTGVIEQIDTETLWAQLTADFYEWFDRMKDQLTEDAAGNLQAQIDGLMPKSGGNFESASVGVSNGATQFVGTDSYAAIDIYFTDTDGIEKFRRLMLQDNGNIVVELWKADTSYCYGRIGVVTQWGGSFKGEMWMENPVPAARTNLKNISILNSDWSGASGNNSTIRLIRK